MRKLLMYMMLVCGLTISVGACAAENDPEPEVVAPPDETPDPQPGNGKSVVLYFSRSGNTRTVATEIGRQAGAIVIEVMPTEQYPSDYNATLSRAQQEIAAIDADGNYPSITTTVDNFDEYDNVFICTPLWYGRMATPMQSFLNANTQAMTVKRVALAVTSSSSGISGVVGDARRLLPELTLEEETLWIRSSQLNDANNLVSNWLKTLNMNTQPNNPGGFDLSKGENGNPPTIKLSSGYDMPIIGLGTYALTGDVCVNAILAAIRNGYRKFDTAYMYHNEESVCEAIRQSGIPREEFFVTTKLYPNQFRDAENAIELALNKLDIEYIDLMLLHHPGTHDVAAYRAMERAVADGKIRSLGLSNYYIREMSAFLPQVTIKPVLVQNEIHPYYQDTDVVEYMHEQGIVVEAWYPLGGRGHTAALFADPVIADIARAHDKSPAQVILRWDLQRGVVVIPGSSNPAHQAENISIFDFELTDEEMARIAALNRNEKHDWY